MQRWLAVILMLSCPVIAWGQQDDKPAPKITWHGHSFFTLTSTKGTVVVFDPHLIPQYGRVQGIKADIVLISHFHNDHTQVGVLENAQDKDLKVIHGLKGTLRNSEWNDVDVTIKDVRITSVGVYHDNMQGLKYGKNTIFIVEVDGWRVVHLGDLGHMLSRFQLKKIGTPDVLMIPVGGIYALNGSEAKKVVAQLEPNEYIFPMHCGTKIYDELLTAEEFLDGLPRERIAVSDDNAILLNRDPRRPRPLIVQLHYWPKK